MVSETRYFKNADINNNELTCRELGLTQTTTGTYDQIVDVSSKTAVWGIRVWKRTSGGVETEITTGTPVAQVSRGSGEGLQSNTWTPPQTSLDAGDSIVVRVYLKVGSPDHPNFNLLQTFQTEDLDAGNLSAAQWTVYYYTYKAYSAGNYYYRFYYGSSTYNSRIENFTHAASVEYIDVSDSGAGAEVTSIFDTEYIAVPDSGLGTDVVMVDETFLIVETGLGTDAVYLQGEIQIDGVTPPHVQRIRVSEPTVMSSKPVPGSLPTRIYQSKQGRTVEIEGWTDSLSSLNWVKSLADGATHDIQLPTGARISVHILQAEPRRSAENYLVRDYVIRAVERMD